MNIFFACDDALHLQQDGAHSRMHIYCDYCVEFGCKGARKELLSLGFSFIVCDHFICSLGARKDGGRTSSGYMDRHFGIN